MRVRWALEEIGQPYDVSLVPMARLKDPSHLARNPFGQIPTYEDSDVTLFESGAIILLLVQQHSGLAPKDAEGRARAIMWMFAALNTVEPPIVELEQADLTETDKSWYGEHRAAITARITARLDALSAWLGDREWLEGAFSAGDLMMVMVLRRLDGTGIVEQYPNLAAFVARGVARAAYRRAFAAQLAVFEESKTA
jgi:glutathione S-transferase